MKANELRTGNKIYFERMLLTVKEIKEHDATFFETATAVEYPDIDPVPLSAEILEACGGTHSHHRINAFESEERYSLYITEDEEYAVCFVTETYGGEENTCIRFRKLPDEIIWLHNFKYLHSLQNAIYMYTGTELTINLEKVKV